MPDLLAADLSNFYVRTGTHTHTYVHKNDENGKMKSEMNQIRQICSAQSLAQQTVLVVMKSLLVEHMMK